MVVRPLIRPDLMFESELLVLGSIIMGLAVAFFVLRKTGLSVGASAVIAAAGLFPLPTAVAMVWKSQSSPMTSDVGYAGAIRVLGRLNAIHGGIHGFPAANIPVKYVAKVTFARQDSGIYELEEELILEPALIALADKQIKHSDLGPSFADWWPKHESRRNWRLLIGSDGTIRLLRTMTRDWLDSARRISYIPSFVWGVAHRSVETISQPGLSIHDGVSFVAFRGSNVSICIRHGLVLTIEPRYSKHASDENCDWYVVPISPPVVDPGIFDIYRGSLMPVVHVVTVHPFFARRVPGTILNTIWTDWFSPVMFVIGALIGTLFNLAIKSR
jgi:hypothetical protein